jgi:predicted nucleic acid-binding protein
VLDRAVEVQDALAEQSQQRGANIADLLIAAAAEAAGLVVLHYDHDYDLIAGVTGQPTEWIVPAGTVP